MRFLADIRIIEHEPMHGVEIVRAIRVERSRARGVGPRLADAADIAGKDRRRRLGPDQFGEPRIVSQLRVGGVVRNVEERAWPAPSRFSANLSESTGFDSTRERRCANVCDRSTCRRVVNAPYVHRRHKEKTR